MQTVLSGSRWLVCVDSTKNHGVGEESKKAWLVQSETDAIGVINEEEATSVAMTTLALRRNGTGKCSPVRTQRGLTNRWALIMA